MPNVEKDGLFSKHLILVIILVAALLITEGLVFWLLRDTENFTDILALTFGTFGAWIGAGAAYFFGRENMKTATDSLIKMSGRTPAEILATKTLTDMKPRAVKTFKLSEHVTEALKWVRQEIKQYLIVVVDDNDKYSHAISDEAIYSYIYAQEKNEIDKNKNTMKDLIEYFEKKKKDNEEAGSLIEFAVKLEEGMTVAQANLKIEQAEGIYIGVILDSQKKPTGYITTNDIRKLLVRN